MHRTRFMFGISALVLSAGLVVNAQGNGGAPKSTPPKPNAAKPTAAKPATPAPHPAPAAAAQAKTKPPTPPAAMASGNKSQAKPATPPASAPKTATKSPAATATAKNDKTPATKVTKADGKTAKSDKPGDTKLAKTEKKSDKPSKTTTVAKTGTTTPAVLTPVQEKLKQNTNLAAKLQERLPKGTDLMGAAAGFRNLGQFVAAVNVSNNLSISFTELKTKLVTNNMSLGQAIQAVRPLTASPTVEAQRAEYDARGMISESEQTESSSAPRTHGPVTTPTTATTPASTTTSGTAKAKPKTTKTSAQ